MKKQIYIILIIIFGFYYLPAQEEETVEGELSIGSKIIHKINLYQ